MSFEKYLKNKRAVIFTFDDTLFPQKDYLLQVYYLFSEFIAYSEQLDSKQILSFMADEYAVNGAPEIFARAAAKFGIPGKYEDNFALLHETARLPLKLLLYNKALELLKGAAKQNLQIFILVEGNPDIAINKVKHIEWNNLEQYLNLYFMKEYNDSCAETINEILINSNLSKEDVVFVVSSKQSESNFCGNQILSFSVDEIL